MKNFKMNTGFLALILGLALVLTQSAFKTTNQANYGKTATQWVLLDGMSQDNAPDLITGQYDENSYRCAESSEVCKTYIDSTSPTLSLSVPSDDESASEAGDFIINP